MSDISSSSAIIMLGANGLFPIPVQMQGFAPDDVFDSEALDSAEIVMGVDGKQSGGFIFVPLKWSCTLQADSPSIFFFDTIYQAEQTAIRKYILQGIVSLPSIGKKFNLNNGLMNGYKAMPDGKKILQPQKFTISWESFSPAPLV